jgi:cobalamin-dependent methionine synthase-like protein
MRRMVQSPIELVIPAAGVVLKAQGIPHWRQADERTRRLAGEALSMYAKKAMPIGLFSEITREEFRSVFRGEGVNEEGSPVQSIYEASDHLALFAVTIGPHICATITELFQGSDFALGAMLDSVASEGTEIVAQSVENLYRQHLRDADLLDSRSGILRFSPGYCGWHISGQRKLFEVLRPGEIGITLNNSFLMTPLKSISGVIVAGKKEIFDFEDVFSFCRDCAEHTCRERIHTMMEQ